MGYNKWTEKGEYPRGERMHGVEWTEVQRGPIEDYLITERSRTASENAADQVSQSWRRLTLILTNSILRVLLRLAKALDRASGRLRRGL
ncbi:MAG: hypothetical protein U5O39_10345 [Gammaproteobacteria bacterium]|nr:hypothetical protein [Gammaproteobacteria bacterium]